MITSRRIFLAGSASLVVTSPLSMPALAASGRKTNLVVVMLRGGMDGLAAAPFVGDDTLVKMRPDINVSRPMKVSGDFALHRAGVEYRQLVLVDNGEMVAPEMPEALENGRIPIDRLMMPNGQLI